MHGRATERLAGARLAALYLLSLVAVAGADLAWRPPSLARLAGYALGLSFVMVLGAALRDASSAWAAATQRRRARFFAFLLLPLPGFCALVAGLAAPALAERAAAGLAVLQLLVLVVCDALSLELVAVWGALVLTLLAAAGGGLAALVGLPAFLVLASLFFSLDHATKRLAAWPSVGAPALRLLLTNALRAVALPAVLLVAALVLLPLPRVEGLAEGKGPAFTAEVQQAYRWLALLAVLGGATTIVVMRWLRGGGDEAQALVELPESHVLAEEILEPDAADDPRYAPARGRVIRAYLRFLARVGEAGLRLERHLTPREIEERVRQPADPLRTLTALFMDARYGPEEPTPEAVRRAEAAAHEAATGLRVRRGKPRPYS
jgi:hypothetical protein